jgi:hypothetical protein
MPAGDGSQGSKFAKGNTKESSFYRNHLQCLRGSLFTGDKSTRFKFRGPKKEKRISLVCMTA